MSSDTPKGTCTVCGAVERWNTRDATGCAMTWHVYTQHRDVWRTVFGDTPPRDPRPEQIGVRR